MAVAEAVEHSGPAASAPGTPADLVSQGCQFATAGLTEEAARCFRAALQLQPGNIRVLAALGKVLQMRRQFDEALACFDEALRLEPVDPWVHTYKGILLLLWGDYDRCWPELEWLWLSPHMQAEAARALGGTRWDGRPMAGRTILLHAPYGGYGDYLMWARYIPRLAATGARVVLQCPSELHPLLERMPAIAQLVPLGPVPRFDAQLPLMSLPHVLDLPQPEEAARPYLRARAPHSERWAGALPNDSGPRVGLVWAVDPTHPAAAQRTIGLAALEPLASLPGVTFVGLQRGKGVEDMAQTALGQRTLNLGPELRDFGETADLISELDLVITVDTAVAHLAGGMGRPVWVLLHDLPDARWLADGEDCPWYPSARLFRQERRGDWGPVAARVTAELGQLLG